MGTINRNANASRSAHTRLVTKPGRTTPVTQQGRPPGVSPEARRRLAECCAFFKAQKYRSAAPGEIRKRDVRSAEVEIETILKNCGED